MFTLNLFEYVEKSCCKMVNFDGAVEEEEKQQHLFRSDHTKIINKVWILDHILT